MQTKHDNSVVQAVVIQPGEERPSTALQQLRDVGGVEDRDAVAIGDLYARSRDDIVNSVQGLIECGRRLATKKAALPHGAWLPWLEENADVLGFTTRQTANRLIKCAETANVTPAFHLGADAARALSREIWGHTPARRAEPPEPATVLRTVPASRVLALMRRVHKEVVRDGKPAEIAEAMTGEERHEAGVHAAAIRGWLAELQVAMEESTGIAEGE